MRKKMAGLTLLEVLLTGSIAVILLSTALPDMGSFYRRHATDRIMADLRKAIALTRASAITQNQIVTLCRSDDGRRCRGAWQDGSIIFTDRNADRILNDDDRLLQVYPPLEVQGSLSFNSFGNRQYLQMTPRGSTNFQNGNFTFCPADGDLTLARQIIISLSGRSRLARDRDGDGIVENSRGRPLQCD